jgi:hypothetical protein
VSAGRGHNQLGLAATARPLRARSPASGQVRQRGPVWVDGGGLAAASTRRRRRCPAARLTWRGADRQWRRQRGARTRGRRLRTASRPRRSDNSGVASLGPGERAGREAASDRVPTVALGQQWGGEPRTRRARGARGGFGPRPDRGGRFNGVAHAWRAWPLLGARWATPPDKRTRHRPQSH